MSRFVSSSLALIAALLAAPSAHAEWSSGGGKIAKDANNPWFINNTKDVSYCVQTDAAHVSLPLEKLQDTVRRALAHWTAAFAELNAPRSGWPVRIGEQAFHEVDCGEAVDVTFQFGVLTDAQRQQLSDPKSFVGIAVRTAYDLKTMRGKGFVYLAADSGELKPALPGLADGFWSDAGGVKAERVLIHELGHVFGIPHRGSDKEIMGEGYPEVFVKIPANDLWTLSQPLQPFFNEAGEIDYELCGMTPSCSGGGEGCGWWIPIRHYFEMPETDLCLRIKGTRFDLEIETRADASAATYTKRGRVEIASSGTLGSGIDQVIKVFIPEGQTAVSGPHIRPNTYYNAVDRMAQIRIQGSLTLEGQATPKSVLIDVNPLVFQWLGVRDGKIVEVLAGGTQDKIR